jgi:hypothetical protein
MARASFNLSSVDSTTVIAVVVRVIISLRLDSLVVDGILHPT